MDPRKNTGLVCRQHPRWAVAPPGPSSIHSVICRSCAVALDARMADTRTISQLEAEG